MSMIECNKLNCRNNYEGECMEVALSRLKISASGTCCNYLPNQKENILKIRDRIYALHQSIKSDLIKSNNDEDRAHYQYQINVINVILHIIDDVEG